MRKLLVMTDLHMTEPGDLIIGLDPRARCQAVLDAALGAHADAEALIIMGDISHHGTRAEYEVARDFLDQVPIPVVPMLGNHDRRHLFLEVFDDAPTTSSGHVQAILDIDDHRIITLDTLEGPPYRPKHHSGTLCPDRLAWLDAALAGADGRMPLVFAHHPPFDTGIAGMDAIRLTNGDELLTRLQARQPAHLLCGHIHRTISGSSRGVPWSMLKSPVHQGVLDLVDVNSSLSVDEPGAYGLVLLSNDGVVVHSEDVGLDRVVHEETNSGME